MNAKQAAIQAKSELWALFKQQHEFKKKNYPEWATYDGDHRFDDRLTDLSHEAAQQRQDKNNDFLKQLKRISLTHLDREDQINHALFEHMLNEEVQSHDFGLHLLNIDQQEGLHITFPQLIEIQPLHSFAQYERYFSRLRGFKKQVKDTIENLKMGMDQKMVLPRHIAELSLIQMAELKNLSVHQMPFYLPFEQNQEELKPELRSKTKKVIEQVIEQSVKPAYQELYDFVEHEYLPACHSEHGLWALPRGEEIYQFLLEKYTEPGLDPEGIHQQGLEEVARLTEEIKSLKDSMGFTGELKDFHQFLKSDPQFYYTESQVMLADYQAIYEQAQKALPDLFGMLPQSPCELKEIEAYRAASAPQAYYYPPPMDRSRPGAYYVNLYDLPSRPRFTMVALTLHEAVPGHHLQLALAQELENIPEFRPHLDCTAFIEGWALYAESLGHQMGMYDDPYQHYGALDFEIWRACRLVVDTGLHALKWSREKALNYLRQYTANSELDIVSEVDRYIALPGQALSYKVGHMAIEKIKTKAQNQLNDKFDLKRFHDQLLCQGSVPLSILKEQMDFWIQKELGSIRIP